MTLTTADLKALTEFLDGLGELSQRTGVKACAYDRDFVELPSGEIVQISSRRDGDGPVTYFVEQDAA
jgi:hypothetical protein